MPVPSHARARARLLQMHYQAKVGHIGGNLSALDVLLHLHVSLMRPEDVFVLSKGHAAGALYIALWAAGRIDEAELSSFHRDNTRLAGHPASGWHPGIRFATGSLGHGFNLAAGVALGKRAQGAAGQVYCLLSDGECEEGSTWEAAIFAHHQKLANLTVIVDVNGLQGFGSTAEVASLEPLGAKFAAFGFAVTEIDGHDIAAIDAALRQPAAGPRAVLLRTIKGKGVDFMEGDMAWHYLPLNETQYNAAIAGLGA
jgi:transketolase